MKSTPNPNRVHERATQHAKEVPARQVVGAPSTRQKRKKTGALSNTVVLFKP